MVQVFTDQAALCRDEDHLALFMELLGRLPRRVSSSGTNAREFFNSRGDLRHITRLHNWPLHEVLYDKYGFHPDEVSPLSAHWIAGLQSLTGCEVCMSSRAQLASNGDDVTHAGWLQCLGKHALTH